MLDRAVDVKQRLVKFVKDHRPDNTTGYTPQDDRLTPKDWHFIERLRTTLEAYQAATLHTQGLQPWLSDWFSTLHWLMNEIDDWRVDALDVQGDEYLATCLTASWNKIEKYYKLVDETPVYYAAILLNPTLKTQKLREMWHTDDTIPWITLVEDKVKTMWRTQYKPAFQRSQPNHLRLYDEDNAFSRLSSAKRLRLDAVEPVDSLDKYLSTDPEQMAPYDSGKSFDVISWWQQRQNTFPGLAQMAFDVFSIPLMSDSNERSFSSGRDMITYRRTRLRSDIIEACQCLKSWYGYQETVFDDEDEIEKDYEKNNTAGSEVDDDLYS
jgi:hypothetical protein